MLLYPGENGPISSMRLENWRDGIEDYDILASAAETLAGTGDYAHPNDAKRHLSHLLGLPADVYGLGVADIRDLRRHLARLMSDLEAP